jgi:hypothetical protein
MRATVMIAGAEAGSCPLPFVMYLPRSIPEL